MIIDTSSSAGSVKSDGGSSADSPLGTTADVTVPRDVLQSMNDYMSGVENLVQSNRLWDKADAHITCRKGESCHYTGLRMA